MYCTPVLTPLSTDPHGFTSFHLWRCAMHACILCSLCIHASSSLDSFGCSHFFVPAFALVSGQRLRPGQPCRGSSLPLLTLIRSSQFASLKAKHVVLQHAKNPRCLLAPSRLGYLPGLGCAATRSQNAHCQRPTLSARLKQTSALSSTNGITYTSRIHPPKSRANTTWSAQVNEHNPSMCAPTKTPKECASVQRVCSDVCACQRCSQLIIFFHGVFSALII